MTNNFENIVVTGASGAIGKAFINNLSKYQEVKKIDIAPIIYIVLMVTVFALAL